MILVNEAKLKRKNLTEKHDLQSQHIHIQPLVDVLAQIPDPRKAKGKRHPLEAMLALTCVALLCGYRSLLAVSEWAHNYGLAYLPRFGFIRDYPPGQATWYRVMSEIDWQTLEKTLFNWVEDILIALGSGDVTVHRLVLCDSEPCRFGTFDSDSIMRRFGLLDSDSILRSLCSRLT